MDQKSNHYQVMLVDDEYYLRQSLRRSVQQLDEELYIAAEAGNGQEALDLLREKDFQIVITDIRMPVMDGLELAGRIHELYPDIVTIILPGYADFEYPQSALRYGVFDYLLKPVNKEDLEAAISRAKVKLSDTHDLPEETETGKYGAEETVVHVVRYMREHFMEDIDMGMLSSHYGFQSAYLTKIFNRYAGEPPLKYLTNIRIQEACRLLRETSLPIGTVGERVGYPDQFHFSKTFRKATGLNPSAYRKQTT